MDDRSGDGAVDGGDNWLAGDRLPGTPRPLTVEMIRDAMAILRAMEDSEPCR